MGLTLDEALNNIAIAIDKYVGTKHEHIVLEQSFNLVKEATAPKEVVADDKK